MLQRQSSCSETFHLTANNFKDNEKAMNVRHQAKVLFKCSVHILLPTAHSHTV